MSGTDSQRSGWQLGGDAPLAYDTYIVNVFLQDYSRRLVETAAVESGSRVLDVACGTGIVARLAAKKAGAAGQVLGLDLNAGMLSRARASAGGDSNIAWHEGSVTDMPFADAGFDVVLCQHGLQFFPDKASALAEIYRVLAPGGRLLLSVWRSLEHCPWQRAVANAVERHVSNEPAQQLRAACSLGDAESLREAIVTGGFQDVDIGVDKETIRHRSLDEFVPGYLAATPAAAAVRGLATDTQTEIVAQVREELSDYLVGGGLAAPVEAHVAIAHR